MSGWTTLACPGAELVVYGGFASQPSASFLRSTAQDYTRAQFSTPIGPIVGKSKAWELTERKRKSQSGFAGSETVSDPNGKILRQATFTKSRSKAAGKVAVLCYADTGTYKRERCQSLTREVFQEGVPGGVEAKQIRIAGITLKLKGKQCWSAQSSEVHCFLDGGLNWKRGNAQELQAFIQKRMKNVGLMPLTNAERQDGADFMNSKKDEILGYKQIAEIKKTGTVTTMSIPDYTIKDIPQRRIKRYASTCRIGTQQARCERIDYYGVLDYVTKYQYLATALDPDSGESVAFSCQHWRDKVAPLVCRQIFGAFVQPSTPKPRR